MTNPIKTTTFYLNGVTRFNHFANTPVVLELHQSEAFQYGNGTCVVMYVGDFEPSTFDTRYEKELPHYFYEWAEKFVSGYFDKRLKITTSPVEEA